MKIDHLYERVADYKKSIETVVAKKTQWQATTKQLLSKTLGAIVDQYDLGWQVQELNWIHNNEAVNITFNSFPRDLIDCTNRIPAYQFIQGGSLVFSESYNGDVFVFVLFPEIETIPVDKNMVELGLYNPKDITEKLIIEMVDEFLKEMIKWEVPSLKKKMGY
jgi:hypothetical protein